MTFVRMKNRISAQNTSKHFDIPIYRLFCKGKIEVTPIETKVCFKISNENSTIEFLTLNKHRISGSVKSLELYVYCYL